MKIGIAGHIAIDEIQRDAASTVKLGGPPCYSGLVARSLGSNVYMYTKVGMDFPGEFSRWLSKNNFIFAALSKSATHETTRFRFRLNSSERPTMQLLARCEDLDIAYQGQSHLFDGILLSPIVGELPERTASFLLNLATTSLLDPQGYLRAFDSDGICRARRYKISDLPLSTIIRMNKKEAQVLTSQESLLSSLRDTLKKGFEIVIGTDEEKEVIILNKKHSFRISIPPTRKMIDTIGLGDIFNAAFLQTFLSQNDMLWAACVATAVAYKSKHSPGVDKINVAGYEDSAKDMFDRASRL